MPRLVADPIPWHKSAATVCVGQGEHPGRFEWELRSGACHRLIDSRAYLDYHPPDQDQTSEGSRTGSHCHPCFLRSKKGEEQRPPGAARRPTEPRNEISHFGASAPGPSPSKNWSPDTIRGSRLRFEWIASGLTAVCFWNAPSPSDLGAGRPRAVQASPWASHWPERFRIGV
jgi:hypothetical protein